MNFFEGFYEIITTEEYLSPVLNGLKLTLIMTLFAAALGLCIGVFVALIKIAAQKNRFMKIPSIICDIYITIIRGTPVALQLFVMCFAIFTIRGFPTEIAASLTFGINSGAYVAESLRAGIQSIDIGQTEAGRSLGLSYKSTMFNIVIPQAVKNIIPAIGNEIIALLKETSIVSMVGLIDLTNAAKVIGSGQNLANYIIPMTFVALFYLAIVYLITWGIKLLERRFKKSDRG